MDLTDGLDARQAEAVTCGDAPLAIIAAAGSGKTTVITRRIAHRILDESAEERHTLAITFSRQAAGELARRLYRLQIRGVTTGTFHAVAYGLLRQRWADLGRPAPGLLTAKHGLIAEAITAAGAPGRRRPEPFEVMTELDWARVQLVRPTEYPDRARAAGRRPPVSPDHIVAIAEAYQDLKRTRRLVDFDDLLESTLVELDRHPEYAAQVRWRFRHFFVDEFQDVNPLQHAVLEAWRGGRADLCVVGDPRQAIYGWNGADPRLLQEIERTYPGIRIVRLQRNYRCGPEVVAAGAAALAAGDVTDDTLAVRPPTGSVELVATSDQVHEAKVIADRLRRLRVPGGSWGAMAVLARTNAQIEALLPVLAAAGIPARSAARTTGPGDNPARRSLLADARHTRSTEELSAWGRDLDDGTDGGDASPLHRSVAAAVRRFLHSVPNGTGPGFVEWFELTGGDDDAGATAPDDAVDLLTFHAAKGREWRTVVVAGAEVGLVPHSGSSSPAAVAEEIRVLYVALTRAADDLVITWAEERNGRVTGRSPLLARVVDHRTDAPTAMPLELRRPAAPPSGPDPSLVALRIWRAKAAHAARLPEQAIVGDDALAAIAAARPATVDDLARLPGVGPLAAHRLGPRLLAALAEA